MKRLAVTRAIWAARREASSYVTSEKGPTSSGPFVWDDSYQITDNQAVTTGVPLSAYFLDRGSTTTRADYNTRVYRPLRNLAFRAIAVTLGVSGPIYRSCNLVLFALSAVLVL